MHLQRRWKYGLYALVVVAFMLIPLTPNLNQQQNTQPISPNQFTIPVIPERQPFWDFWLTIRDWLIRNLQSGHQLQGFFGSFTSNIPEWIRPYELLPTVQAANLGGSTLGSLTYVDPSFSLAGGKYDYAATFGHYTLSLAKSENAYIVAWQSPDAVGKKDVASTAFILLENGNFLPDNWSTQVTFTAQTPYALNDHFDGSWEVRQKSSGLLIGTAHLIVQFQRTALPKISANIVKEWYYTNPLCTSSPEECPTETYWNQVGLGSLQWVWQIAPNAGCDSVNGLNVANLTASSDGTKLSSSGKLDFASCSWSASWQEYGSLPVEVQVDGDKKGKGVFSKGAIEVKFPVNMDSVDPTFGITTAGTSAYQRAKTVTANGTTGTATISTTQSEFGGASGYFVAANQHYLSLADSDDWYVSGNFTTGGWVYFNSFPAASGSMMVWSQLVDGSHFEALYLYNNAGTYTWTWDFNNTNGTTKEPIFVATTISTLTWYHIELDNSSGSYYMFQDGTQVGSTATCSGVCTYANLAGSLYIGQQGNVFGFFNGYLDDVFTIKGSALHTSNFTKPSAPYSRTSGMVLLLPMDGANASTTFLDDVITGQTFYTKATLSGSATVTSVSFCSLTTSGSVILAIWTDSSGPSVLLWNSSTSGTSVNASACSGSSNWTTINISSGSPTALNLGTASYWLGFQWTFVSNTYYAGPAYASGGANTGAYTWDNFGTLQSTVSGPTLSTENYSEYVTYTAGASGTPSEIGNVSDALARLRNVPKSFSDALNLVDTLAFKFIGTRALTETLKLVDTVTGLRNVPKSLTDTLNLTETLSRYFAGIGVGKISDTLNLTDAITRLRNIPKSWTDILNLMDTLTFKFVGSRSLSDTLNLTETIVRLRNVPKTLSDILNLVDALTFHFAGIGVGKISDVLNLSDSLTRLRNVPKSLADVLSLTDTLTFKFVGARNLSDVLNLIDTFAHTSGKRITETLTLTDTLKFSFIGSRSLTDTLNLIEALGHRTGKFQSETLTFIDTFSFRFIGARNLSDPLNITDALAHAIGKPLTDVLNLTDSLSRRFTGSRTNVETLNITDLLLKGAGKSFTDSINITDTLLRQFFGTRPLSDILNITDLLSTGKMLTRNLADTLTLTESLTNLYTFNRPLADNLILTDLFSFTGAFSKSFTDALGITDALSKGGIRYATDILNLADSLTRSYFGLRSNTDTLTLTETLNRQQSISFILSDLLTITDNLSAVFTPFGAAVINVSITDMLNLSDLLALLHVPAGGVTTGGGGYIANISPLIQIQLAAIPRIATLDYLTSYPLTFQLFLFKPTAVVQETSTVLNGNATKETIQVWYVLTLNNKPYAVTPKEQHVINPNTPTVLTSWILVDKAGKYTITPYAEGSTQVSLPPQTVTITIWNLYEVMIILWSPIVALIAIIAYMSVNTVRSRREEARRKENEPPEE